MFRSLTPTVSLLPLLGLAGVLLVACGGKDSDEDSSAEATCEGGTPPVVSDVYCENTGIQIYGPTGEEAPTLTVWADVEDEDHDLESYTVTLFFDDVLDGTVSREQSLGPSAGYPSPEPCGVSALLLGTTVYLRGGQPLYETPYEWGVVVTDATGLESELVMVTCTTPNTEGEGETQ